jgi:endonuclease/exonuclease/phosphatase family metal-dependent hydrolase
MVTVGTWNLENLFRPKAGFGPANAQVYRNKLAGLAAVINNAAPDVLGVQEVGDPDALHDLVDQLHGEWHTVVSKHFEPHHPIRVAVLSRHPLEMVADVADFPTHLAPVQVADDGRTTTQMGRGALAVRASLPGGAQVVVAVCHLKSKLLTFPSPGGGSRFNPHDEGERARYGAYALFRRAAEAVTVRALADDVLAGKGADRDVVVLGDLNDEPDAATTQILLGPPGPELTRPAGGNGDEARARNGANANGNGNGNGNGKDGRLDGWRLWNLAPLLPRNARFSRMYHGRGELIDQILVSKALVDRIESVRVLPVGQLPSVTDDPRQRRHEVASDHAPVMARLRH